MMTIEQLLNQFSNENGFQFGIDIVMKSLRPNALYELKAADGIFEITRWNESNELPQPSVQEIRDEYIRHKTIKEFLWYLQSIEQMRRIA